MAALHALPIQQLQHLHKCYYSQILGNWLEGLTDSLLPNSATRGQNKTLTTMVMETRGNGKTEHISLLLLLFIRLAKTRYIIKQNRHVYIKGALEM